MKRSLVGLYWGFGGGSITEEFIIPSTFTSWFTNNIYWHGERDFSTDFDFSANKNSITGTVKYVDNVLGSNANNGNTSSTPYQTLQYCYQQGGRDIRMRSGRVFTYDQGFKTSRPSANTKFSVYDGTDDAYMTTALDMVYSQNGTYPVVYQATSTEPTRSIVIVFDLTYKDSNGSDITYTQKTSILDVSTTPGSFYYDTTADILYVRTWDSRVPDSSVYACLSDLTTITLNNAADTSNLHFENIRFIGGRSCDVHSTVGRTVSFSNCRATGYNTNGGFWIQGNVTASFYYCRSDYNQTDGFNYQNTCKAFEWYCESYMNARDAVSEANNGSTGHASSMAISVGGSYLASRGKAVQWIGSSKCLYIGAIAGNSLVTPPDDDTAAYASDSTQPGDTDMWFYLCQAVGASGALRYWNFPTSVMNVYDGSIGNVNGSPNRADVGSTFNVLTEAEVFV